MFKNLLMSIILAFGLVPAVSAAESEKNVQYNVKAEEQELSRPEHDSTQVFFNKLGQTVKLPPKPTIVVLGWDTGKSSDFIANQVPESKVINFILNKDYISFAAQQYPHPQIETRYGDITQPQEDLAGKADLVYSTWVVGFVPSEQQVAKLKNMLQMLKKDGTAAVLFPIKGSKFSKSIEIVAAKPAWQQKFGHLPLKNRISYEPSGYAKLMREAGFKGVHADRYPYTLTFATRAEFEAFVRTGISRYSPHLTQEESDKFVKEIAEHYVKNGFANNDGSVPYTVDMLLATGKK